mmetsp:Transcript_2342/g.3286  ORF Transcript_2342/g.3286 Transcript_2342/m.3286 type:complete len:947 (-) Transcript_2342:327-3167(-)
MSEQRNPVVASLPNRSQNPYTSVALSPDGCYGIAAGKGEIRIFEVGPKGLREIRSMQISQYFRTAPVSNAPPTTTAKTAQQHRQQQQQQQQHHQHQQQQRYADVRDTFGIPKQPQSASTTTVTVTDVAWSLPQVTGNYESSVVAVAGSNGAVVILDTRDHLLLNPHSTKTGGAIREAILTQHTRAVNKLAWHPNPKRSGCLLTASQDATVCLWERQLLVSQEPSNPKTGLRSWFRMANQNPSNLNQSVQWRCIRTFEPKFEAVRDIRWSPYHEDAFAIVTSRGSLIVYNINFPGSPWVTIVAHNNEATSVDWHPTKPYWIATGGVGDRCVKIFDLERAMSMNRRDEKNLTKNFKTGNSQGSEGSESSIDENNTHRAANLTAISSINNNTLTSRGGGGGWATNTGRSGKSTGSGSLRNRDLLHVLSISASVTRIRWRPPSNPINNINNLHESMIAVATSGASAGGNGVLSLWSHHRPFMPLSVVEGHKLGAVTDFNWIDTPDDNNAKIKSVQESQDTVADSKRYRKTHSTSQNDGGANRSRDVVQQLKLTHASQNSRVRSITSSTRRDAEDFAHGDREMETEATLQSLEGTWQHVLSVGRDGRCLLQSFARGDLPITRVPPSCFAMANLSPFQSGYGSLQIFSVHQMVPSSPLENYALTGLRRDAATAKAPGVFREAMVVSKDQILQSDNTTDDIVGQRLPKSSPMLVFNVIDQGDLDEDANPIQTNNNAISVAPEVVHLSRFAKHYKLYPDDGCKTKASLCFHNAAVAQRLNLESLSRMWRMVATLLEGGGEQAMNDEPQNAMQFALFPTVESLLEERANAGDVQTCVALCEILQVVQVSKKGKVQTIKKSGLELNYVREWYLSYIDLLQQMCLFSLASALIGRCKDPVIGALNKTSTTLVLFGFHLSIAVYGTIWKLTFKNSLSLAESTRLVHRVESLFWVLTEA